MILTRRKSLIRQYGSVLNNNVDYLNFQWVWYQTNHSVTNQYAILLRNYGIAFSQAAILIVNNFGKSLFKTMENF